MDSAKSQSAPLTGAPGEPRKSKAGSYQTFDGTVGRFNLGGPQDLTWAVLFVLHLLGFVGYIVHRLLGISAKRAYEVELEEDVETGYFPVLGISLIIATIFAIIWTVLIRKYARPMLYVAAFLPLVLMGTATALAALQRQGGAAAISGISFCFLALYLWWIWDRLAFTAVLLETSAKIMLNYSGTLVLTVCSMIPGVLIALFYMAAGAVIKFDIDAAKKSAHPSVDGSNFGTSEGGAAALILCTVFSFYWTWAVLGNVVHTTICGVVGRWYFLATDSSSSEAATSPALKQAMTTNFGSIALGSFIMAIIKTLKFLAESCKQGAKDQDNPIALIIFCILACIISCIESAFNFVSTYAYVYVALYGCSFCTGASETFKLFCSTGLDMLVAFDYSGLVSLLGSLVGALVTGCSTWGILLAHGRWREKNGELEPDNMGVIILFAACIGFGAVQVVGSAVESGCCSLLVCYAEAPEVIESRHPELGAKINELQASLTVESDEAKEEDGGKGGAPPVQK